MKRVSVKTFIEEICTSYRNESRNGRENIKVDVPDVEICIDTRGLTAAVRNLIDDALKNFREPE